MATKKMKKPANKAEENFNEKAKDSRKATRALEKYLKENNLDPSKDWTKDKKHGPKIKELIANVKAKSGKSGEALEEVKKAKKAGSTMKYSYPLVDGREMTSEEKKKYRVKMRAEAKKANGGSQKPSKKEEKVVKPNKDKKPKENEKVEKKSKKKDGKKPKKEED